MELSNFQAPVPVFLTKGNFLMLRLQFNSIPLWEDKLFEYQNQTRYLYFAAHFEMVDASKLHTVVAGFLI